MSSLYILALLAFDALANLALAVNLVTYFNSIMHFNIATASNMVTNFMGVSYIVAILWLTSLTSRLEDTNLFFISSLVECLGLGLLTIGAHHSNLRPPACNIYDPTSPCEKVAGGNLAFLCADLYMTAIGMAGNRASVAPHGADQFDNSDIKEALQMLRFFNWVLLSICIGGAFSLVFIVWIQTDIGWGWGFGVPAISIFVGIIVFSAGIPKFRIHLVEGTNPITEILQVPLRQQVLLCLCLSAGEGRSRRGPLTIGLLGGNFEFKI